MTVTQKPFASGDYGAGTPTTTTGTHEIEGIDDMSDDILLCRLNHLFVWRYDFDIETNVEGAIVEYKRFFTCPRCKTDKTEVCNADHEVKRRKMDYGPGYLLKKPKGGTVGRIRKSAIRKAHFGSKSKNNTTKQLEGEGSKNENRTERNRSGAQVHDRGVGPQGASSAEGDASESVESTPLVPELPTDDGMGTPPGHSPGDDGYDPADYEVREVEAGAVHRRKAVREEEAEGS